MLLKDERLPNAKFVVGKQEYSTDSNGMIEIKDNDAIKAFVASGFKIVSEPIKKTATPKVAAAKVGATTEKVEKTEKVVADETPVVPVEAKEKPRWARGER